VARIAAHLAGVGAAVALAGWVFHLPVLATIFSPHRTMKANTALGFMLLAGALHFALSRKKQGGQAMLAAAAAILGAATLFQYAFGISLGIDTLLVPDPSPSPYPGRMAPASALNFLVLGIAFIPFRSRRGEYLREALVLTAMLTSLLAVVGYIYGVPTLYGDWGGGSTAMAFFTGTEFLLIATGILFVPRERGLVRIFWGRSIGSMMARYLIPMAILVPILLGALFANSRFSSGHLRLAMTLSVVSNVVLLVALIWSFAFTIQRSEAEKAVVQRQAQTDRLTGIYNRRYFETSLQHEVERARRYSTALSLIIFDVDHFKHLNDHLGHLAGDRVLISLARECERSLRDSDVFCRFGGEEFAIIAPETNGQSARLLAQRIRQSIVSLKMDGCNEPVTISLGIAAWDASFERQEDLIYAADKALYYAKNTGRNREHLYGETRPAEATVEGR
jgi:diguanylate cyclase (GGDEF)-like protein